MRLAIYSAIRIDHRITPKANGMASAQMTAGVVVGRNNSSITVHLLDDEDMPMTGSSHPRSWTCSREP